MDQLSERLPFGVADIDTEQYTLSLLGLCAKHGLLSETRQAMLKTALDKAFLETAAQYTRRASSTIDKETANRLYDAILFRWEAALRQAGNLSQAVRLLQEEAPEQLLTRGDAILGDTIARGRVVFRAAFACRLGLPVPEYRFVMDKAFDQFLQGYDARFDPRSCVAAVDYPLLHEAAYAIPAYGPFWVLHYYTAILLENRFCACFSEEEIEQVLQEYGAALRCHYAEMVFNIAELVTQRMLAATLLGEAFGVLRLNTSAGERLREQYGYLSPTALEAEAEHAFEHCATELTQRIPEGGGAAVTAYFRRYVPCFAAMLHTQLTQGAPARFLFVGRKTGAHREYNV